MAEGNRVRSLCSFPALLPIPNTPTLYRDIGNFRHFNSYHTLFAAIGQLRYSMASVCRCSLLPVGMSGHHGARSVHKGMAALLVFPCTYMQARIFIKKAVGSERDLFPIGP